MVGQQQITNYCECQHEAIYTTFKHENRKFKSQIYLGLSKSSTHNLIKKSKKNLKTNNIQCPRLKNRVKLKKKQR